MARLRGAHISWCRRSLSSPLLTLTQCSRRSSSHCPRSLSSTGSCSTGRRTERLRGNPSPPRAPLRLRRRAASECRRRSRPRRHHTHHHYHRRHWDPLTGTHTWSRTRLPPRRLLPPLSPLLRRCIFDKNKTTVCGKFRLSTKFECLCSSLFYSEFCNG